MVLAEPFLKMMLKVFYCVGKLQFNPIIWPYQAITIYKVSIARYKHVIDRVLSKLIDFTFYRQTIYHFVT
jgi:hypothetical protein